VIALATFAALALGFSTCPGAPKPSVQDAAEPPLVAAHWSILSEETESSPAKHIIVLDPDLDLNSGEGGDFVDTSEHPFRSDAISVTRDGASPATVATSIHADWETAEDAESESEGSFAMQLEIHFAEPPDPEAAYTVHIRPDALFIRTRAKEIVAYDGPESIALSRENLKTNLEYSTPLTEKPGFDLKGGGASGTLSFHFEHSLDELLADSSRYHLDVDVQGDFALDNGERNSFFNSVTAELRGYRQARTTFGGALEQERYVETGLHYRVESDQTADNIDQLLGLDFAIYTKDPISTALSRLFVPEDLAVVTPLIRLEYNRATEVTEDSGPGTGTPTKPDTSDGSNRFEASLDWSLPMGRDLGWNVFPATGTIQSLDLLVQLNAVHDSEESEWFDNSKVTLRFSPEEHEGSDAALELTWAHGETAPLFDQVDALLAGIRITK